MMHVSSLNGKSQLSSCLPCDHNDRRSPEVIGLSFSSCLSLGGYEPGFTSQTNSGQVEVPVRLSPDLTCGQEGPRTLQRQ